MIHRAFKETLYISQSPLYYIALYDLPLVQSFDDTIKPLNIIFPRHIEKYRVTTDISMHFL